MIGSEEKLIEVRHLKKYFKTKKGMLHAVDNVNFEIIKGKTLGVVGESGCGKSTLGRTLLRLIEPTEGEILYEGNNIVSYGNRKMFEMRKKMQLIFQDPYSSLNPRMSVSEIITEPIKVCKLLKGKKQIEERVREYMNTVGLAERLINAYPHELDGGRRQRIGIARALAVEPEFIVCDEPVSALDVSIQAQVLNLLMDLQEERGLTYLFITHDLSVVKHISDEILVMYLGECVEKAETNQLFSQPLHPYTKALLKAIPSVDLSHKMLEGDMLKGEVTSPINPKPGCRFASRCPYCRPECTSEQITLREVEPGHFVACNLYK